MLNTCYFTLLFSSINFVVIESTRIFPDLLFDVKENSLVQVEAGNWSSKPETLCHYCATARPADTEAKIEPNGEESVGKSALILEDIYERCVDMNQIKLPQSYSIVQTSYLFNMVSGQVEIGYEILDINNKVESFQKRSNRDDFLSLHPSIFSKLPVPKQELINYTKKNSDLYFSERIARLFGTTIQTRPKFIWIPVLLINLNMNFMSPTQIKYRADLGNHVTTRNCSDFTAASEFYDVNVQITSYSYENQRMLLTGDEKQSIPIQKGEPSCGSKYGCLVRHQIIPAYYLHSFYGKSATCSFMNTVPIWGSIVERINIINKYLYAMSQIWTSQIHLTTGFFKVFKPSAKYFERIPVSRADQKLYLDQANKTIPVPMFIYKIVEYKMKIPPSKDGFDYYYAVIVIHNDPTSNAGKERICEKKDRLKGWEDITSNEKSSGLTYVCPFSKKVADNLHLDRYKYANGIGDLKLNHFPLFNATQRKFLYQDKKQQIRQKIKELF